PIFFEDRQTVAFDRSDWAYLNSLLQDIILAGETYITPIIKFLRAFTFFHLDLVDQSIKAFQELENDPGIQGRRRLIRSFLASWPDGSPRLFSGTIDWINVRENRGSVFVPDIFQHVRFILSD